MDVSLIIPTTCESARATLLRRAVASAANQADVALEIIVVVNGPRVDQTLLATLETIRQVHTIRLHEGNVSLARLEGLRTARGEFFCFLDDDDELLPDALATRLRLLRSHPEADIVVTNGYEHVGGQDDPLVETGMAAHIANDPGDSFLRTNWFASPASMFRADAIPAELFDFRHKYFEWTYLFYLLLSKGKRFIYDEALTYRKFEDNPLSASKSYEYAAAYPDFLLLLCQLPLAERIKKALRNNYLSALNTRANLELAAGRKALAWHCHLRCLKNGGWRYLPFTRRLLWPSPASPSI